VGTHASRWAWEHKDSDEPLAEKKILPFDVAQNGTEQSHFTNNAQGACDANVVYLYTVINISGIVPTLTFVRST
jgi:hypothetical protein